VCLLGCTGPADPATGTTDTAAASSSGSTSTTASTLSPAPEHLVGADGRTVIHRGINLSNDAKSDPTYHHGRSPEELALLPAYGITAVRYLVFWEAVEPAEGDYDDDYLAQVRADLDALDALGLEVVLDLHQDLYGEGFGATGFPGWTCDDTLYDAFESSDGAWYSAYTDPALIACFDAFWASADLQEAYARMTAHLTSAVGDHPAVTGLDVINEPYWGSYEVVEHDQVILPAFYAAVLAAVRSADPDLRLWLAPSVANNLVVSPQLDLSNLDDDRIGFTPHFYPLYAEEGTGYDGDFEYEADALSRLMDFGQAAGVPTLLGEFGIFSALGGEDDYVRSVLQVVESRGGSTAWWSFDNGSGVLTTEGEPGWLLDVFAEPFAHRIPGRLEGLEAGAFSTRAPSCTRRSPGTVRSSRRWSVPEVSLKCP